MSPLRPLTALLVAGAFALGLAGCSSPGASTGTATASVSEGPTASAAPTAGATLDPADFAAALKRPGTTVLDVRTPQEYAEGHLPGAVNLDVEDPAFATRAAALDPAGSYAVYCRSGNRSQVAIDLLAQQGFGSLYHLGGGIQAWEEAGGEIVTG